MDVVYGKWLFFHYKFTFFIKFGFINLLNNAFVGDNINTVFQRY